MVLECIIRYSISTYFDTMTDYVMYCIIYLGIYERITSLCKEKVGLFSSEEEPILHIWEKHLIF